MGSVALLWTLPSIGTQARRTRSEAEPTSRCLKRLAALRSLKWPRLRAQSRGRKNMPASEGSQRPRKSSRLQKKASASRFYLLRLRVIASRRRRKKRREQKKGMENKKNSN